jgi:hypothetical protein
MSTWRLPLVLCPLWLDETVARRVNVLNMGMYSCGLDCGLVVVYRTNVFIYELLPMGLGDVGQDGREVSRRLADVWDGRVEGARLVIEHSRGDIRCLWLLRSVQASVMGNDSLPLRGCTGRTVWRNTGIWG